jgi:dTDP-4-dehydrorhamnose reductase
MTVRLCLTGADGMLGRALTTELKADPHTAGWAVRGVSLRDFDIADTDAVNRSVEAFGPDIVVHTAANAIVDDCERDPAGALRVNTRGVRNVTEACRRAGARLVYISSDYVFDGLDTPPGGYREDDVPGPLSVYGITKLAGEQISAFAPEPLSVRTSWLFGGTDPRVDTVLATVLAARRGEPGQLVHDQFSIPTYTVDLARALVFLLTRDKPVTGTIHVAGSGSASWYDVGRYLVSLVAPDEAERLRPRPVPMDECGFLGGRPRDSTLSTDRLRELGFTMPSWQNALRRFCATLPLESAAPVAAGSAAGAVR